MTKTVEMSVDAYISGLPDDRRAVLSAVRDVIVSKLPTGYKEALASGMISYVVPLERYPQTYNGQPLVYLALAAQKNHYSLYMVGAYQDAAEAERIKEGYREAVKKLDMGKSCVRFRTLNDIALEVIGESVARISVDSFIEQHEKVRARAAKP